MSVTVANIITNLDAYIGDTTTNSLSSAERLQYITEATVWLQEELQNDLQNETYELDYFDTIHTYKVTTGIADLFEAVDLRRSESDHTSTWLRKSAREMAEDIGMGAEDDSYAIERYDDNNYLVINHTSKYQADTFEPCESLTENATWQVDAVNSDATNLTLDTNSFTQGSASFNFDVDVSQSGNNRATIYANDFDSLDWSTHENLSSIVLDVDLPDVTYITSVTVYWGSSSSSYWSASATTAIGGAFENGTNTIKVDWANATMTSTPTSDNINYVRIDINYSASQADDTDFRIDNIRIVRPEKLTFYYTTWSVGTNSGGTKIYAYSSTNDIPFYSGQYDQYKYAVARKAASLVFYKWREREAAMVEDAEATRLLQRAKNGIPSSRVREEKSFKSKQINFNRRKF